MAGAEAPPSPRSAARELGHRRHVDHGLSSAEVEALNASAQLDQLEDAGDQVRLLALADCYRQRAELSRQYGAVLVAAQRLTEATAAYDRALAIATADELADQLESAGVVVLDLDAGSSPTGLSDAARLYQRLARIASEAAAGLRNSRAIGELLGVGQ